MKKLPETVAEYARTKVYDQNTVPAKLTAMHETKTGVWGIIEVQEGVLEYHILCDPPEHHQLTRQTPGIIEPAMPHYVTPKGAVRFQVIFLK